MEGSSCWRILEFYSGIGAMVGSKTLYSSAPIFFIVYSSLRLIPIPRQRYSLMRAGVRGRMVEAFDINNIANDVYEHNFGHRPFQVSFISLILHLTEHLPLSILSLTLAPPPTRQQLQIHYCYNLNNKLCPTSEV